MFESYTDIIRSIIAVSKNVHVKCTISDLKNVIVRDQNIESLICGLIIGSFIYQNYFLYLPENIYIKCLVKCEIEISSAVSW